MNKILKNYAKFIIRTEKANGFQGCTSEST